MGAQRSKPMREAPVRFVAKQLPKVEKLPMELQFKKPEFTKAGINRRSENVNTEPLMYVETARDETSTEVTDHTAPRWYLNSYLEMLDNQREERVVISGNFPLSWERDKFEPYALVKGRIDEEDLDWLLKPENAKKPLDELVPQTKLERHVLQDLLDTVELPRRQFRNYKGKLHKTVEDTNAYLANRKVQVEKAREAELLRKIGYSEEDVEKEDQYLTQRSRGVKALDDLGASLRNKKRMDRSIQSNDMERMLEQRRIEQIESGTYHLREEELADEDTRSRAYRHDPQKVRVAVHSNVYLLDNNMDERSAAKFQWWLDRTRRIRRGKDTIHGAPIYNQRLAANDAQMRDLMKEAAEFQFNLGKTQGAKGFVDPRGHYDEMVKSMRESSEVFNASQVEVHDDGGEMANATVFRHPHTKSHPPAPTVDVPPPPSEKSESDLMLERQRAVERDVDDFLDRIRPKTKADSMRGRTVVDADKDAAADGASSGAGNSGTSGTPKADPPPPQR